MVRSKSMIRDGSRMSKVPQPFKFIILLLVGGILVMALKHFDDAYEKVRGVWKVKPKFKEKVDVKVDSFDECEVYYLLALTNGLYDCIHCESDQFYLQANEIAKIGMTCNGKERYNQSFYKAKNVRYQVVFLGNSHECQKEEIRRLGAYANLPENMSRPDRSKQSIQERRYKLLFPVLNSGLK